MNWENTIINYLWEKQFLIIGNKSNLKCPTLPKEKDQNNPQNQQYDQTLENYKNTKSL